MVKGINKFKNFFRAHTDNYIIIGGTACDMIIDAAGLTPRVTHDIDIILIVEALSPEFVAQFWAFVKEAGYKKAEKNEDDRKYYRFKEPADDSFPYQVELFSRQPDLLDSQDGAHLTPIPVDDEELSSLSAILMNEDYYSYTREHCTKEEDLHRANIEALVCLKARAYLDLVNRKEQGERVEDKHIKKHKADVFRLSTLLPGSADFELPESIHSDLQLFADSVKGELPDPAIFKSMGLGKIKSQTLLDQLIKSFRLR